MVKALVELGATISQADMDQNTALQYCIAGQPDMVQVLLETDKTGAARAINHLAVSGGRWNFSVASPLMRAVAARDSLTAMLLLTNHARPSIDFSSYMKACQLKQDVPSDSKRNKQDFEKKVHQPVVSAIQSELPDLARTLITEYGADVNTLTTSGWSVVHDEYMRRYTKGETLLDAVRAKVSELKDWKPEQTDDPQKPIALQDDTSYLAGLSEGTYKYWSAKKQLEQAKQTYEQQVKTYQEQAKKVHDKTGLVEKEAAVHDMESQYRSLEVLLVERDAKTFAELYPDIKDPEERNDRFHYRPHSPAKPKPFEVGYSFRLPDLTDETHARYMKLFQAAWSGDIQTTKELTLAQWKTEDGDSQPPLQVATQDQHNLTPFHIAILQGNFELGSAIMEIAKAQYLPADDAKRHHYGVNGAEGSEYDSDNDDDDSEVALYSEIIDDEFTVENVGEVSTQVKSRVTPLAMLRWNAPVADFMGMFPASASTISSSNMDTCTDLAVLLGGPLRSASQTGDGFMYFGPRRSHTMAGKRTNTGSLKAASNHISDEKRKLIGPPRNLIQFALHNDDHDLLLYLLSLGKQYTEIEANEKDDAGAKRFFTIDENDFLEAIKLDRPHLLVEMIKHTGAGIPLDQLVANSGVEIVEKPKYYQGLSVYGKKRKDWADRGRDQVYQPREQHRPPFLEACRANSLDTIEWFLSDAPMRAYKEFASTNADDKRLKLLAQAKGGFEAVVTKFLTARTNLAIHCCLLSKPIQETEKVLRFLIKTLPDAVDRKSMDGITPLALCFRFYRVDAAKILIEAGADQTVRTGAGENLIHNLLRLAVTSDAGLTRLRSLLELIDKRLLKTLFTERSAKHPGSLTPLAQWIQQVVDHHSYSKYGNAVLQLILEWSKGAELNFVNGEGNAPIHVAVRQNKEDLTRTILECDPTLVMRENATGRTPYEMGEDSAIAAVCSNPPQLSNHYATQSARRGRYVTDLVNRDAKTFVEVLDEDPRNARESVWDMLKATKTKLEEQGIARRRLVTLNEANEVARRLAASRASNRHVVVLNDRGEQDHQMGMVEQEAMDEVQLWLPQASTHLDED